MTAYRKNSVVCIGTVRGSPRKLEDRDRFESGLCEMVRALQPHTIVVYGYANYKRFDDLLKEYEAEQKELTAAITETGKQLSTYEENTDRAEQFLVLTKKYTDFSELTTQMINEFIEKIIVHAPEKVDGDRAQEIEIYLKFIGRFDLPAPELTPEEEKRQESLRKQRIRSWERYRKIQDGLIIPSEPFKKTCVCCGKEFKARRSNAMYCSSSCQQKCYRQQAAQERSRECACGYCGKTFTTARWNAKYCSEECRHKAQIKRQGERKAAERKQKTLPQSERMVTDHVE